MYRYGNTTITLLLPVLSSPPRLRPRRRRAPPSSAPRAGPVLPPPAPRPRGRSLLPATAGARTSSCVSISRPRCGPLFAWRRGLLAIPRTRGRFLPLVRRSRCLSFPRARGRLLPARRRRLAFLASRTGGGLPPVPRPRSRPPSVLFVLLAVSRHRPRLLAGFPCLPPPGVLAPLRPAAAAAAATTPGRVRFVKAAHRLSVRALRNGRVRARRHWHLAAGER